MGNPGALGEVGIELVVSVVVVLVAAAALAAAVAELVALVVVHLLLVYGLPTSLAPVGVVESMYHVVFELHRLLLDQAQAVIRQFGRTSKRHARSPGTRRLRDLWGVVPPWVLAKRDYERQRICIISWFEGRWNYRVEK